MSKGRAAVVALGAGVAAAVAGITVEGRDPRLAAALWALAFILIGCWLVLIIQDADRD